MRIEHPSGDRLRLSYCTNVHPAESVQGIIDDVVPLAGRVRQVLGVPALGLGLWLPVGAAAELAADPDRTAELRRALDGEGLEVVGLNAFPYQAFHAPTVKKAVYHPDWSRPERLRYTLDCAAVLADLLPEDLPEAPISTLPLAWRTPWSTDMQSRIATNLRDLERGLVEVEEGTGRRITVGFEPEPGCVVETVEEAVAHLSPVVSERIGVCLDTAHLATGFEDPARAAEQYAEAGIPVVKIQASAALHAHDPADAATREALLAYREERFLHQVRTRSGARIHSRDDIDRAMDPVHGLPTDSPWRVHFHTPVHAPPQAPLSSTREELRSALAVLVGGPTPVSRTIEVETYTWSVLPAELRPADELGLATGLAAELAWVREGLAELDLEAA